MPIIKSGDDIKVTIQISFNFRASIISGITMVIVLMVIVMYFWKRRNRRSGKFFLCKGNTVWVINYSGKNSAHKKKSLLPTYNIPDSKEHEHLFLEIVNIHLISSIWLSCWKGNRIFLFLFIDDWRLKGWYI